MAHNFPGSGVEEVVAAPRAVVSVHVVELQLSLGDRGTRPAATAATPLRVG